MFKFMFKKSCFEIVFENTCMDTKMQGGNTHFNSDRLNFKGCSDVLIPFWCKKKDTFAAFFAFCNLCNALIQTKN